MPVDELIETASAPEIIWTATGLIGLLVNLTLSWQAWGDYRALVRLGQNGGRKLAARTAIGVQAGLTLAQLIAVGVGVLSLLIPPANPAAPVTTPLVIVTVGILLIEIILVVVGVLTHIGRMRLLGYFARAEESAGESRHAETMAELTHNTEMTTEASASAMQSTEKLRELVERLERERGERADAAGEAGVREDRADARSEREQDRQDVRDDRRDERERNRT